MCSGDWPAACHIGRSAALPANHHCAVGLLPLPREEFRQLNWFCTRNCGDERPHVGLCPAHLVICVLRKKMSMKNIQTQQLLYHSSAYILKVRNIHLSLVNPKLLIEKSLLVGEKLYFARWDFTLSHPVEHQQKINRLLDPTPTSIKTLLLQQSSPILLTSRRRYKETEMNAQTRWWK